MNKGTCNWVRKFGDYMFTTDCGQYQGLNIRPKQKTCFCGKEVRRFVQSSNGDIKPVIRVQVHKGIGYYFTD